jgi:hypothetical protein
MPNAVAALPSRSRRVVTLILACAAWLALACAPAAVRAETFGEVTITMLGPLATTPDSRTGGWVPFLLVNDSDSARTVTLSVESNEPNRWYDVAAIRRLTRTFELAPKSRSVGSWIIPVAVTPTTPVRVTIDGNRQTRSLSALPSFLEPYGYHGGTRDRHSVLMTWGVKGPVRDGIESSKGMTPTSITSGSTTTTTMRPFTMEVSRHNPSLPWPQEWLGYTEFRAIVITPTDWEQLESAARRAALEYVAAGGSMFVLGSADIHQFTRELPGAIPSEPLSGVPTWRLGLGLISVASEPTALSDTEWDTIFRAWTDINTPLNVYWSAGQGETSLSLLDRSPVPTRPLLGALLLFGLLIGPVNMITLARTKRRVLLFVTTPALGLLFAVGVLVAGVLRDGFDPYVRTAAFTFLDQNSRTAISTAHVGILAPLTPGDGVSYDLQSLVMLGAEYGQNTRIDADMTGRQHYAAGLVTARSPAHIRQVRVAPARERLVLETAADGSMEIVNALGAPIVRVIVASESGELFETTDVAPGARAKLTPRPEDAPGNIEPRSWDEVLKFASTRMPSVLASTYAPTSHSVGPVPAGGYYAFLGGSPFVDTGLTGPMEHDVQAVVIGRFEGK